MDSLIPDNPMNAFAFFSPTASNETSLGWNHLPAYGEVMNELRGIEFTGIPSMQAPTSKTNLFMESFWNTVRGQMLAHAA